MDVERVDQQQMWSIWWHIWLKNATSIIIQLCVTFLDFRQAFDSLDKQATLEDVVALQVPQKADAERTKGLPEEAGWYVSTIYSLMQ